MTQQADKISSHVNIANNFRNYLLVRRKSYFWALRSFQMFADPLLQTKLHLLITVLLSTCQSPTWNQLRKAVPGKFNRSDGHSNATIYKIEPIFTGLGHCINFNNVEAHVKQWFIFFCVDAVTVDYIYFSDVNYCIGWISYINRPYYYSWNLIMHVFFSSCYNKIRYLNRNV